MLQAVALVAIQQLERVEETQEESEAKTIYPEAQVVQVLEEEQLEQFDGVQFPVAVLVVV